MLKFDDELKYRYICYLLDADKDDRIHYDIGKNIFTNYFVEFDFVVKYHFNTNSFHFYFGKKNVEIEESNLGESLLMEIKYRTEHYTNFAGRKPYGVTDNGYCN